MSEQNSIDISQQLADLENEIKRQNDSLDVVTQEYSDIKKKLIESEIQKKQLELKKADIMKYISMAKHSLENTRLKYEGLKRDFWACKREGK